MTYCTLVAIPLQQPQLGAARAACCSPPQPQHTPFGQSTLVMTTSAPAARQTSAMRSSSVATTTACSAVAFRAWRYVLMIMGTPRIGVRGFPGTCWTRIWLG